MQYSLSSSQQDIIYDTYSDENFDKWLQYRPSRKKPPRVWKLILVTAEDPWQEALERRVRTLGMRAAEIRTTETRFVQKFQRLAMNASSHPETKGDLVASTGLAA